LAYESKAWTTTEETNALKIPEWQIVGKICRPVKGGERWRTNKEIKPFLQWKDTVNFIKSLRLRWYGHVEKMQDLRLPQQIAIATIKEKRKRGKPRKRWRDEFEEDLNIVGTKTSQEIVRDRREWREILLEATVHNKV
jgi:hypothetical protein